MFKNDRMMMILTGLVLAIFAGSMAKYGDRIINIMSGGDGVIVHDDSYSVRAGSSQILDVLSNDKIIGPIVVLSTPSCGSVELTGNNKLSFSSPQDCTGEVAFAYCVDNEGECASNEVRINVISVNVAQAITTPQPTPATPTPTPTPTNQAVASSVENTSVPAPAPTPVPEAVVASNTDENIAEVEPQAPIVEAQAPVYESFGIELSPPSLATPDISELVSPNVAVAAIRRPITGLDNASNSDANITTQASAAATQASTVNPSTFQAPSIGESSNVSLGGSQRVVASVVPVAPAGLSSAPEAGNTFVQLERGPEALFALASQQAAIPPQETAPLSANAERSRFAPIEVAAAQTTTPSLEDSFNAAPNPVGPIALIALQRSTSSGAAGESLNLTLSEPGVQIFGKALVPPLALPPTSAAPSTVTVLERPPSSVEGIDQMSSPMLNDANNIMSTLAIDPSLLRGPIAGQNIPQTSARQPFVANNSAVGDNLISIASQLPTVEQTSNDVNLAALEAAVSRLSAIAELNSAVTLEGALPSINLAPAALPEPVLASLPVVPVVPVETAPAQNSTCEISLSSSAARGALIELDISAACKPNKMVTINHSGLSFSVLTNANGVASVTLPAMAREAVVNAVFADGSSATTELTVRDVDDVLRSGVSWSAAFDLNLNAFEYGAAIGSDGHVSALTPRDFRTSRVRGGGYLLELGDNTLVGGSLAEVYTMPITRGQLRGTVALSIILADASNTCGQIIVAKTSQSREGRSAGERNVRFSVPECGTVSADIELPSAISDIRIAGR